MCPVKFIPTNLLTAIISFQILCSDFNMITKEIWIIIILKAEWHSYVSNLSLTSVRDAQFLILSSLLHAGTYIGNVKEDWSGKFCLHFNGFLSLK